jgi:ATP diphosphatase
MSKPQPVHRLIEIMALLRHPESGCPWDVEQDFRSIVPHTIEEAYEVAEAIENDDMEALPAELGDLLLQVVFHARMAEEAGLFDFADVVGAICDKLVRRHPHVFGDASVDGADAQTSAWEGFKANERHGRRSGAEPDSAVDGVATTLPALTRALKLQKRAARIGFDWDGVDGPLAKLDEETAELRRELDRGGDSQRLADEVGDLLFTCVNLARKLGIDPETALRRGNHKFETRFRCMEGSVSTDGRTLDTMPLTEKETYWRRAKDQTR